LIVNPCLPNFNCNISYLEIVKHKNLFMIKSLIVFLILIPFVGFNQNIEKRTISGYITDEKTGEKLIGATVLDAVFKKGAATNDYGIGSLNYSFKKL